MWGEVCSRQKLLDKGNSGIEVRALGKGTLKTLHKFIFSALNYLFPAYNPLNTEMPVSSQTHLSFLKKNYHTHTKYIEGASCHKGSISPNTRCEPKYTKVFSLAL